MSRPGPEPVDDDRVAGAGSAGQDREPRRLRWALRAYPSRMRREQGDLLLSLARDLVDAGGSSANREALGLLYGGFVFRAGGLADAPWAEALRRAALRIAGVLCALVWGAAWWLPETAWPGWAWLAVLTAPTLVLAGQLTGRRVLVAAGALALLVCGVAQGNSHLPALGALQGTIEWRGHGDGWRAGGVGFDLPLLACAIPAAAILLASAAHRRRPVRPSVAVGTVAWAVAGAIAVRLVIDSVSARPTPYGVTLGDVRLNGLALCMVTAGVAALAASAVSLARRRRDPSGMLARAITVAAIVPVACLYAIAGSPLQDVQAYAALAASVLALIVAFVALAHRTEPASWPGPNRAE